MKQWNGLLKKEWITMSGNFYAIIGVSIFITFLFPLGSRFFDWGIDAAELSHGMGVFWMVVSMSIPTVMLLISFGKEMGRPDILLHSTASIYKLFGTKVVFSGFVGFISITIPVLNLMAQSELTGRLIGLSFNMIFILFFVFLMAGTLLMCLGLFLGVVYQLIKPIVKGLARPIVVILFFILAWVVERITSSAAYKKIVSMGPGIEAGGWSFSISNDSSLVEMEAITFHTGNILMNLFFAIVLFVAAAVLFEKKVRI